MTTGSTLTRMFFKVQIPFHQVFLYILFQAYTCKRTNHYYYYYYCYL